MIYAQMQMQMQLQMLIAALVKDTIMARHRRGSRLADVDRTEEVPLGQGARLS